VSSAFTKQGVRNLDSLASKPRGVRLAEPPIVINCRHKQRSPQDEFGERHCLECGQSWDWEGKPAGMVNLRPRRQDQND
jgi:hypothetical protein